MRMDTVEKITRLYQEEQGSGRKAIKRDDIPIHYEAITPEWLTAVLCVDHPGAEVTNFSLGPRDDGTTARRRIFVSYNQAGQDAGLPSTVFAKSSQQLLQRTNYALNGYANKESDFFNFIRPKLSIEVPRPYFANYDPESCNSIVLLQDREHDVEFCSELMPIGYERSVNMVQLLADLHSTFAKPAEIAKIKQYFFEPFSSYWDRLIGNQMKEYCDIGFLAAEDVVPARLYKRAKEVWPRTMDSVGRNDVLAQTFCHGDTHIANWYVTHAGAMGLTDWQCTYFGHWSRDVVYALSTALDIDDRRKWEKDLISIYLDRARQNGWDAGSFDEAWTNYRQQSLTALAYWTVTLTPSPDMPEMQPRDRALRMLKRISAAVDDLEALDSFD